MDSRSFQLSENLEIHHPMDPSLFHGSEDAGEHVPLPGRVEVEPTPGPPGPACSPARQPGTQGAHGSHTEPCRCLKLETWRTCSPGAGEQGTWPACTRTLRPSPPSRSSFLSNSTSKVPFLGKRLAVSQTAHAPVFLED